MSHLHEDKIKFLEEMASTIRQDVIAIVSGAGSGHIGGSYDNQIYEASPN